MAVPTAEDLKTFLKNHNIKTHVACACSGGVDSLAMTLLMAETANVTALIIDHSLRPESAAEAKKTARLLTRLGIKNTILTRPNNIKSNLQEEARNLRYELLTTYCQQHKIKYLATAHHADDNAETFLLRLSRGSGVDGLSGIAEISAMNGIKLIRPVLRHTKTELEQVLKARKIKPIEDPTNQTGKYKRNSLRHALEKLEDRELITARINDAAQNLARVRDFLETETEKAYAECISGTKLNTVKLSQLHDEIAYRVLVKLIMETAKPDHKPRFEKLKRLKDDLITGKTRTLNGLIFRSKNGLAEVGFES